MTPPPTVQARKAGLLSLGLLLGATLCLGAPAGADSIVRTTFGQAPEGGTIEQFTLSNGRGATARILTYGAIVADLRMPDRQGRLGGVVREIRPTEPITPRTFANAAAVFGRVANRIARGRFPLDGREVQVTTNAGVHHIHGGRVNFSKVLWQAQPVAAAAEPALELRYASADGEEGFPGRLDVAVTYTLTRENTLRIQYYATTTRPTPVNLTNHAYFNLAGGGDVARHELQVDGAQFTEVDADLIPTGRLLPVAGTPLDFLRPRALGDRAAALGASRRYDHNFVLPRPPTEGALRRAARIRDSESGRTLEVWTTEPGLQLYTSPLGEPAAADRPGFYCFETQHFPDSVNHPEFPTTLLRPGAEFRSTTEYRFGVE